jgi:hypothetical protein
MSLNVFMVYLIEFVMYLNIFSMYLNCYQFIWMCFNAYINIVIGILLSHSHYNNYAMCTHLYACFSLFITTLTQKTESMFHSVSFHALYFENEWAKSKWVNTRVVVSKIYYNHKKTWSKKQLRFGSKWISKLTTSIDSIVWPIFRITKKIENASIFLAKMTSIFYNMLLYIIWDPPPLVL